MNTDPVYTIGVPVLAGLGATALYLGYIPFESMVLAWLGLIGVLVAEIYVEVRDDG